MIIQKKVKIFLKKTWRPPQISKNLKIPQDSEEPKILEVSQNNLRISQEFWKSSKIWKFFWKQPEKKSSKSLEFFQNFENFPPKKSKTPQEPENSLQNRGRGDGGSFNHWRDPPHIFLVHGCARHPSWILSSDPF